MDEQGLGRRLQVARQAASLTQQELCQKAGIAYSTLAKIERGAIKAPSVFTIAQIAHVLGVSLNDLLGIEVNEHGGVFTPASPTAPAKQYKRSKSGVTFVYFDINGCLVHFFHRAFTKLAADFGASPDTIESTFWHYNDAVCRGEIGIEEFNRLMADKLHVPVERVNWMEYYMSTIEPVHEMRELLTWAADHFRIGLLSNIMPGFIDEMMKRDIIPTVEYTAIIDSSKVHAIKPEPKMYEFAQAQAGVPGNEILFVDDSRANLMAAERLGWHVLWFDDFQPTEAVARVRNALALDEPEHDSKPESAHRPETHPDTPAAAQPQTNPSPAAPAPITRTPQYRQDYQSNY